MKTSPTAPSPDSAVQEAQKLYREFHARCFWSFDPHLVVTADKINWVRRGLRHHGGMRGWKAAQRLPETPQ